MLFNCVTFPCVVCVSSFGFGVFYYLPLLYPTSPRPTPPLLLLQLKIDSPLGEQGCCAIFGVQSHFVHAVPSPSPVPPRRVPPSRLFRSRAKQAEEKVEEEERARQGVSAAFRLGESGDDDDDDSDRGHEAKKSKK